MNKWGAWFFLHLVQQLLDSKAKVMLLSKLLDKQGSFSVSELARLAGLPKATVSGIVIAWEKAGLVLAEQQGRNKLVRINQKFYLLPELKKIFEKTGNFQKPLFKELRKMAAFKNPEAKAIVVFGSRARNDFSHASDFDVLICIEKKDSANTEEIVEEFVKATQKTGTRFSPVFLDKAEIKARLREKDRFIKNILTEGKILKGSEWLGHLQTALGFGN